MHQKFQLVQPHDSCRMLCLSQNKHPLAVMHMTMGFYSV